VPGDQTYPVVLLYVHALLGEGIASYVTAETGVPVRAVSALDHDAVVSALAELPRVVIFERAAGVELAVLTCQAPGAVLIDVSAAVTTGTPIPEQGQAPGVETIVHAVVGAGFGHSHAS
jgi:hypothetical protein